MNARTLLGAAALASTLALGACSSGGPDPMETMRSDLASTRAIAEEADRKATAALAQSEAAAADAQSAAQEARTASEKADRIFRAGLRK
ncbi:MAG: hypothetical protein KDG89_11615 [Geminicoccaceae bacterium]|nr:hypothetical protein [Geminicoccaceae bacterium]